MLEEEFSEVLETLESPSLDEEQVALAKYWKDTTSLQKHWKEEVVGSAKMTLVLISTALALGLIYLVASPLSFIEILSATFAIIAGIVGVLGTSYTIENFFKCRKERRALPPVPENYSADIGALAHALQVNLEQQSIFLLGSQKLHRLQEEIEADRVKLQTYQLHAGKPAHQLSEREWFMQFEIKS